MGLTVSCKGFLVPRLVFIPNNNNNFSDIDINPN